MNTHDKYELPPLPADDIADAGAFMGHAQVMSVEAAQEYARAAIEPYAKRVAELESQLEAIGAGGVAQGQRLIEADRKRRGEPGLLMVQEADTIPHFHPEYGPGIFFTEDAVISPRAQQPAEPVKRKRRYAQGTALGEFGIIPMCDQVDDEPVKVPSDDEILFTMRHLERHLKCIDGAIPTLLSTARALLARYGRPAP